MSGAGMRREEPGGAEGPGWTRSGDGRGGSGTGGTEGREPVTCGAGLGADAVRVSGVSGAVPGVRTAERRACVGPGAAGRARGVGTARPHGCPPRDHACVSPRHTRAGRVPAAGLPLLPGAVPTPGYRVPRGAARWGGGPSPLAAPRDPVTPPAPFTACGRSWGDTAGTEGTESLMLRTLGPSWTLPLSHGELTSLGGHCCGDSPGWLAGAASPGHPSKSQWLTPIVSGPSPPQLMPQPQPTT